MKLLPSGRRATTFRIAVTRRVARSELPSSGKKLTMSSPSIADAPQRNSDSAALLAATTR